MSAYSDMKFAKDETEINGLKAAMAMEFRDDYRSYFDELEEEQAALDKEEKDMMLSKETLEILAEVCELKDKLFQAEEALGEALKRDTNGVIGLCVPMTRTQLYHYSMESSVAQALDVLKDIADDGLVIDTGARDDKGHYNLCIDRHPMCIVLDREDDSNE